MIIEHLEDFYRAQAVEQAKRPKNIFRASSMGYCVRRLAYDKLGINGTPLTPRRLAVLRHGEILDGAMKIDLGLALKDKFLNLDALGRNTCEIEGVEISFTPDGAFQTDTGEIGIIEFKTMSDYAFNRALVGEIERAYLCQAWVYQFGTSFNPVVFICYRKQTSHCVEVIFDRNAKERVVTQRFGGNPIEIAINDTLLVAEVRTPFDALVEEEVREKIRALMGVTGLDNLPVGVNMIEAERVKAQGKAKAQEAEAQYGKPVSMAGSWFTFETGRKMAGFPCSYCPYVEGCLGARLEIKDNRPVWVIYG